MADKVFEYINHIMESANKYDEDLDDYEQFLTNRALSLHPDVIMFANEVNVQGMTDRMHYDYCFYAIRKMRRKFAKWPKRIKNDDLQLIMDYHQINRKTAESYLPLLTDDQLKIMKANMEQGG